MAYGPMRFRARTGRILLTAAAVFTIVSPFIADWNSTHIFNPLWPPHAKFHAGQTMSLGVLLGLYALPFIWRQGDDRSNLIVAVLFVSLYWISQLTAFAFPGAAWIDPNLLLPGQAMTDVPIQIKVCAVILPVIALGTWLIDSGGRRARSATGVRS